MPSITERIQAVITSALGVTPSMYTGDWHKYMDAQSIAAGQLNERQIALANTLSGSSLNSSTALIYLQSYFLRQQNLLTFSEQFDNAAWTKSGATVTADQSIAPDGTLSMDKIIESAVSASHYVTRPTASMSIGTAYAASIFAKAGERSLAYIWGNNTVVNGGGVAVFDLTAGTVVSNNITNGTPSITNIGGGIYRLAASFPSTVTADQFVRYGIYSPSTSSTIYTGDGVSGLYLWGAQLNTGPFALEYSRTDASALP